MGFEGVLKGMGFCGRRNNVASNCIVCCQRSSAVLNPSKYCSLTLGSCFEFIPRVPEFYFPCNMTLYYFSPSFFMIKPNGLVSEEMEHP